MTPDEYKKTTDAFMKLCEIPMDARQTALDELGRQDPKLCGAVEAMLRHDDDGKGRLQSMTQKTLAIDRVVGQVVLSSIARVDPGSEHRYERTRLHATGGMGQVWLARDNSIGRNVALKELRPEGVGTLGINSRFLNEAKVTGQLEHPGIVPVYEVATDASGKPFYTMRFVKGRTLHEEVQEFIKRRTPFDRFIKVAIIWSLL